MNKGNLCTNHPSPNGVGTGPMGTGRGTPMQNGRGRGTTGTSPIQIGIGKRAIGDETVVAAAAVTTSLWRMWCLRHQTAVAAK